jgi:hypothetical protein
MKVSHEHNFVAFQESSDYFCFYAKMKNELNLNDTSPKNYLKVVTGNSFNFN